MGGGLAFLSKKSFNPSNISNQKNVWKAEQRTELERKRVEERNRQLQIERDHEEMARARDGKTGGLMASLRFMYDTPSGSNKNEKNYDGNGTIEYGNGGNNNVFLDATGSTGNIANNNTRSNPLHSLKSDNGNSSHEDDLLIRKEGDDDAAASFRQMLANARKGILPTIPTTIGDTISSTNNTTTRGGGGLILTGVHEDRKTDASNGTESQSQQQEQQSKSKDELTQLEKAVGRKADAAGSGLSYSKQIERFPQLKNAPTVLAQRGEDSTTNNADKIVHFKPLGAQIRNIRCLKCGVWGHSRGDRECSMSGWDPFAAASSNQFASSGVTTSSININDQNISSNNNIIDNDHKSKNDNIVPSIEQERDYESSDSSDKYEKERKHKRRHRHQSSRKKKNRKKNRYYEDHKYRLSSDEEDRDSYMEKGEHERHRECKRQSRYHRRSRQSRSPSSHSYESDEYKKRKRHRRERKNKRRSSCEKDNRDRTSKNSKYENYSSDEESRRHKKQR